ncbi:hypothetical protein AGMMS49546_37430 [Spirochaetia bacterium]|nr:hypothetical protein AGMMS49546_37430 [Spirochaetia bacterium]
MKAEEGRSGTEHNRLEKYLRLLLKNSPDNILFIDSRGYIDYCSDTFLKLSGLRELDRVRGMHFRDMYSLFEGEAFVAQAERRFADALASKITIQTSVTINFPGIGEARLYTIQTTPMIDDKGNFEGAQVLYHDVTDLLNTEVAERSRALLDAAPLACSLWDADGTLLDCNKEALRMFGLSKKQEYVDKLYKLSPEYQPDGKPSREGMAERDNAAIQTGFLQFEWMHQTLSGEPLPVESTLVRIPWMDSYVFATYSRDLREIKKARDELRRISSLVEATPNFVLYTDGEGNIKYANPAVIKTSGFSKEELLEGGLALFTDKRVLQKMREEYLPQIMDEHSHITFEHEVTLKDGRRLILLSTMFTVVSQYGEFDVGLSAKDITELKQITAEKERINIELNVASDIQNGMLPPVFPAFSNNSRFLLFAKMQSAKKVGGDFYDFFYLNSKETKIVFVIADVSGKGVPAALFMVIAKTLIKQQMLLSGDPAAALEQTNRILCKDNPQCMFVTIFICTVDLVTGHILYANGGHNPPLLSQSNKAYHFMHLEKGLPLGVFETSRYKMRFLQLNPGDKLYLYTDGVNEAKNTAGEQFSNKRFLETANQFRELEPEQFDGAIRNAVEQFSGGADQSDDITTLAIHYTGNPGSKDRTAFPLDKLS